MESYLVIVTSRKSVNIHNRWKINMSFLKGSLWCYKDVRKFCTYKNKYVPYTPTETCPFTSRLIFGSLCMVAAPNAPVDLWILPPALFKIKKMKELEILIYWTACSSHSISRNMTRILLSLGSCHLVRVVSGFYYLDALST